jgi:hypothetical protein
MVVSRILLFINLHAYLVERLDCHIPPQYKMYPTYIWNFSFNYKIVNMHFDITGLWTLWRSYVTGYARRWPYASSRCWRVWAPWCTSFGSTGAHLPTASLRQMAERLARRGVVGLYTTRSLSDRTFRRCTLGGFWRKEISYFSHSVFSRSSSSLLAGSGSYVTMPSKCYFNHLFFAWKIFCLIRWCCSFILGLNPPSQQKID